MSEDRDKQGRFVPGVSGNPSGLAKDARPATSPEEPSPAVLDGWSSAFTGIGNATYDKRQSHTYCPVHVANQDIARMWETDDICATAIEAPGKECFREGYELTIADEGNFEDLKEQVEEKLEELGVNDKLKRLLDVKRAFGGSAMLLGADDGLPLDRPLDPSRVRSLDWMNVLEPVEIFPYTFYNDAFAPKYGEPEIYQLSNYRTRGMFGTGTIQGDKKNLSYAPKFVHESRLIVFRGIRVSEYYLPLSSEISPYWGTSIVPRFVEVLRDFNVAWSSAGILATDFSQTVITMENLMALVAKAPEKLRNRMLALELGRSTARALLVDKNEKVERQSTSLAGLAELLDRISQRTSAATGVPLSIMMGYSPATLGTPDTSELDRWHDICRGIQKNELTAPLMKIIKMIMGIVRKRKLPKKWGVTWNDLKRMTILDQENARLTRARSDALYLKGGVVTEDEVRNSRFRGGFSYETQIDEKKKAPGPQLPPAPGGGPAPGGKHVVSGYARKNPAAPAGGQAAPKNGGDAPPDDSRDAVMDRIVEENGEFVVTSESGDRTFGRYKSRGEAEKRLAEIEYFKAHHDAGMTAEDEVAHHQTQLERAKARGAKPAELALLQQLIEIAQEEADECAAGTCGPDCLYSHEPDDDDAPADADGPGPTRVFAGIPVVVESPAGSVRAWRAPDGTEGQTQMTADYGYVAGTLGTDGDSVDVYLGPREDARWVYVVHQLDQSTDYQTPDEDKCMLGYASPDAALEAYLAHRDDPRAVGGMSMMSVDDFKKKIASTFGGTIANDAAAA